MKWGKTWSSRFRNFLIASPIIFLSSSSIKWIPEISKNWFDSIVNQFKYIFFIFCRGFNRTVRIYYFRSFGGPRARSCGPDPRTFWNLCVVFWDLSTKKMRFRIRWSICSFWAEWVSGKTVGSKMHSTKDILCTLLNPCIYSKMHFWPKWCIRSPALIKKMRLVDFFQATKSMSNFFSPLIGQYGSDSKAWASFIWYWPIKLECAYSSKKILILRQFYFLMDRDWTVNKQQTTTKINQYLADFDNQRRTSPDEKSNR